MKALIDGLLNYSRVGKEKLPLESVNVNELVREIINSLSPPASFKIINHDLPPVFLTKRLLLNQVLSNLINNAIKHHDSDRGEIELTVVEYDKYY